MFAHCPQTKLEFEKVYTKGNNNVQYRAKIVTKRNDSRLNNHQPLQLQDWRANCDIKVVIDHYACVEYLTKMQPKVNQGQNKHLIPLFRMLTIILTHTGQSKR